MNNSEHKKSHAYAHYSSGARGDAMANGNDPNVKRERKRRMRLSRDGERLVSRLYNGTVWLRNREPFDIVNCDTMFEVKTMWVDGADMKVHIADDAMERKREWIRKYNRRGILVVVVTDGQTATIYESELRQYIRISQMRVAYVNVNMK